MKKTALLIAVALMSLTCNAKTLIAYYSDTGNIEKVISALQSQIEAEVIEIEPAEKGLDYEANNYAIGSAQIAAIRNNPTEASSYPAIDPVNVNLQEYDCVIIGAPLWWSQMAAPMQTWLFENGASLADKKLGLIVSSASSGISGVEADAKHLIPNGDFLEPYLWVRSSQTSNAAAMVSDWLTQTGYNGITSITEILTQDKSTDIYTLSGVKAGSASSLKNGLYIINGKVIKL